MNVVLLVVDSLRRDVVEHDPPTGARTPFLDRLRRESVYFVRAYATECWTLPSHASMFTGLLPSEHGAHFASMAYAGATPTLAERLAAAGYATEVVTRNSIFDGAIPGINRGFAQLSPVVSPRRGLNPLAIVLALSKPRFRRQILTSGFFHPLQRQSRRFVISFARAVVPADGLALEHVLRQLARWRRERRPYFAFCNLYDVHAPYPPTPTSIFRSFRSPSGCVENLVMPFVLPKLGGHAYLRRGFRLPAYARRMLFDRYRRAVELMDAKLGAFYQAAMADGLLDDTLLVVTSDHGEAFGDHGLYLHDASVFETHLRVPLYVRHPAHAPTEVSDVVSMRDLGSLIRASALGEPRTETILDAGYRARHPVALAEHFHYRHAPWMDGRYRQDLVAAVSARHKAIVRGGDVELYDLARDPDEATPARGAIADFEAACRAEGLASRTIEGALRHLTGLGALGGATVRDAGVHSAAPI